MYNVKLLEWRGIPCYLSTLTNSVYNDETIRFTLSIQVAFRPITHIYQIPYKWFINGVRANMVPKAKEKLNYIPCSPIYKIFIGGS